MSIKHSFLIQRRREIFWSGAACRRQFMEACSDGLYARSAENFFHLHFSVVWMGSHSTVVLCTALSLTSAFHVIRDITE